MAFASPFRHGLRSAPGGAGAARQNLRCLKPHGHKGPQTSTLNHGVLPCQPGNHHASGIRSNVPERGVEHRRAPSRLALASPAKAGLTSGFTASIAPPHPILSCAVLTGPLAHGLHERETARISLFAKCERWPDASLSSSSSVRFAHEAAAQVLADLSRLAPHGQRRRPAVQDLLTLWRLPGLRSTPRRVKRVQSPYLDVASAAMRLLAEASAALARLKANRRL
jgi:hypothetical protein